MHKLIAIALVSALSIAIVGCSQPTAQKADNTAWNARYAAEINNNVTGIAAYKGNLYVYGSFEGTLKKINLATGDIQTLTIDFIKRTHGLTVANDAIWLTDTEKHQIYKLDLNGKLIGTFGIDGEKGCDAAHFFSPTKVTIAPNGNIYVTDGYGNRRIVCLDPNGKFLFDWGKEGTDPGQFMNPHDIIILNNKVYIADRENFRVQIFDMNGKFLEQWPMPGKVFGICYDSGKFYLSIVGDSEDFIIVTDNNGNPIGQTGSRGTGTGQFDVPHSLTMDKNFVYVAEVNNKRIQRLSRPLLP